MIYPILNTGTIAAAIALFVEFDRLLNLPLPIDPNELQKMLVLLDETETAIKNDPTIPNPEVWLNKIKWGRDKIHSMQKKRSALSTAEKVGITVGIGAGLFLVGLLIYKGTRRKK